LSGFIGIALLWLVFAFWKDYSNQYILSNRISKMIFTFQSPLLILVVSALIGGLIGGMAGMSGGFLGLAVKSMSKRR
jgi:ABC-type antimicrobial peptide transport system permease subunit